jgi:hypothetical protein
MLSTHPRLNPAVFAQAELFTDGQVTDAILRNVASMRGLPLLIEPGAAPSPATERRQPATQAALAEPVS